MELADLALDDDWIASLDVIARDAGLALAPGKLAAEVRALSDAYNAGDFARSRSHHADRGTGALAARLAFSFPRDVPKMACAVRELVAAGALSLPADRAIRVLDVGAGLGASTWGLARMLAANGARGAIDATLLDHDSGALAVARAIGRAHAREGEIDVRLETSSERASPSRTWPLRFDVILVGQSLGEIDGDEKNEVALLSSLVDRALDAHGSLVVVEPALRDRTRRLHRVRAALLAQPRPPTIFAPCLHAGACPMLAENHDTDWCHEDLPIDLPRTVATLARAAGLRWQGLTFSYLVLRKDGLTLRTAINADGAARIVSLPLVTKGKRELFLCGEGALRRISRLDRDEYAVEARGGAFSNASRGDVISFSPPLADDAKRAGSEVTVCIEHARPPGELTKTAPRGTS